MGIDKKSTLVGVALTTDRKRLVKCTMKIGLQQDGLHQILEGLKPRETRRHRRRFFPSNALTAASVSRFLIDSVARHRNPA